MKTIVKSIIRNDRGEILTLFRGDTHPKFPGARDFPGGEMETGESPEQTLLREIREETGLKINAQNLRKFYGILVRPDVTHVLFFAKYSGDGEPKLSWEHKNYEWIREEDLLALPLPTFADDFYENAVEMLRRFPDAGKE